MFLDQLFDQIDACNLTHLHVGLAFSGFLLSIYVMALTGYEADDHDEPPWAQWLRRFGYALAAASLLWTISFMESHKWQPWPPMILLILSMNVMLVVRAFSIHYRIHRYRRPHRRHRHVSVNMHQVWAGTAAADSVEKKGASHPL